MTDVNPQSEVGTETQPRRSVLGELPRTRPQRVSARRETARALAQRQPKPGKAKPASRKAVAPPRASSSGGTSTARAAAKKRPLATRQPPASEPGLTPTQGYEAESELIGEPVSPPSGTELIGALAELAGELAQGGVAAGGRLLRGALSRLSGS